VFQELAMPLDFSQPPPPRRLGRVELGPEDKRAHFPRRELVTALRTMPDGGPGLHTDDRDLERIGHFRQLIDDDGVEIPAYGPYRGFSRKEIDHIAQAIRSGQGQTIYREMQPREVTVYRLEQLHGTELHLQDTTNKLYTNALITDEAVSNTHDLSYVVRVLLDRLLREMAEAHRKKLKEQMESSQRKFVSF
jgi:hypothetical protein